MNMQVTEQNKRYGIESRLNLITAKQFFLVFYYYRTLLVKSYKNL